MSLQKLTARLFYSPAQIDQVLDRHADQLLIEAIQPTLAHAYAQGWFKYLTFLRFSEQGYHLRFMFFGEAGQLQQLQAWLQAEWGAYLARHPQLAGATMPLSPYASILNRKMGHATATAELQPSGSIIWERSADIGIGSDFESLTDFTAYNAFQSAFVFRSLELLRLGPELAIRKTFVRLLVQDLLQTSGLRVDECYKLLQRLQQVWVGYFELNQQLLASYQALLQQKAPQYRAFYAPGRSQEQRLAVLPEAYRPVYRAMLADARRLLPAVIQRNADGAPTLQALTAITGLIHLMHNRLSVPITDEVYLTLILSDYYAYRMETAAPPALATLTNFA
jgi:hypothetical protein